MERLADTYVTEKAERRETSYRLSLEGYAFDIFTIAAVAVVLVLVMQTRPAFRDPLVLKSLNEHTAILGKNSYAKVLGGNRRILFALELDCE